MNDLPTIAFIGLPLLTGFIGVGLGYWLGSAPNDEGYWQAIAERNSYNALRWVKRATESERKFVNAAKECNRIQDELDDALASNLRLTDALQAKNERLERIVEAFEGQRSGTARKAVKIALGDL